MRTIDCSIFLSSLRSRSRVRSSRACSSSMVARSAGSGTTTVSSRRCSVVSPALFSMSCLRRVSLRRKKAVCFSFMYSLSGMASTSSSVSWSTDLVFQLLASLGSFLIAERAGEAFIVVGMVLRKLALAAVDATAEAVAMDGTVNWVSLEDGRALRCGDPSSAGAGTSFPARAADAGVAGLRVTVLAASGGAGGAAAFTAALAVLATAGAAGLVLLAGAFKDCLLA